MRGGGNRLLRRHKDDIKRYYRHEDEASEDEETLPRASICQESEGGVVEEQSAEGVDSGQNQPVQPPMEALPAEETVNLRTQRQRRLPERFGDFVMNRIRMVKLGSVVTSGLT